MIFRKPGKLIEKYSVISLESLPVLQLWPEVPDKTLNWPGSAVSQSTDGVALNLEGEVLRNISLRWS